MSDNIENLRWLYRQLDADAEAKGIGQGSEGGRYCLAAADELAKLREEIVKLRDGNVKLREERDALSATFTFQAWMTKDGRVSTGVNLPTTHGPHWCIPLYSIEGADPSAILAARDARVKAEAFTGKLWLWRNFVNGRPEYWAFDNPFPTRLDCGDPQTLGEPCGYALFKPSRNGRPDVSEDAVLRRMADAIEKDQS